MVVLEYDQLRPGMSLAQANEDFGVMFFGFYQTPHPSTNTVAIWRIKYKSL